ncbi:hypothetical protein [Aneurinibacillus tyrosinisolvens]|uniref:hypothetical protein n=1 Tax=Aneurinibacillus tyrosinisolvens TaxID=1443435 RepID=UPI00063F94E8|nr:hypothetical protein [Aneurinibacillus tyrosinisolvens]
MVFASILLIVWARGVFAANYVIKSKGQSNSEGQTEIPEVFKVKGFSKVKIPIYVPTHLPLPDPVKGSLYLLNAKFNKNNYSFDVFTGTCGTQSMADWIVTMTAGEKPASKYPIEIQMLKKPSGIVELHGVKAQSFDDKMMLTWKNGNWDITAIGHAPNDGIRVAREVIVVIPKGFNPVPGVIKGQFRASQTGNPMYVDASWTYDGKIWYELHGRSDACLRTIMLLSMQRFIPEKANIN